MVTPNGMIENEFQWIYILRLDGDTTFTIEGKEVSALVWKPLDDMAKELHDAPDTYVSHGKLYFDTIFEAIATAKG
jgi:isopentenyldiphosphate isomerase